MKGYTQCGILRPFSNKTSVAWARKIMLIYQKQVSEVNEKQDVSYNIPRMLWIQRSNIAEEEFSLKRGIGTLLLEQFTRNAPCKCDEIIIHGSWEFFPWQTWVVEEFQEHAWKVTSSCDEYTRFHVLWQSLSRLRHLIFRNYLLLYV